MQCAVCDALVQQAQWVLHQLPDSINPSSLAFATRDVWVQAGGVEVFARLLFKVSDCEPESLSSPPDKDSKDASESAISAEVWSAAMGILNLVVLHSPEGSKRITQVWHHLNIAHMHMSCCRSLLCSGVILGASSGYLAAMHLL